jgi:hypothetical protein
LQPKTCNFVEKCSELREVLNEIVSCDSDFAILMEFVMKYHKSNNDGLHLEFTKLILIWQQMIMKLYVREGYENSFEISIIIADSESFNPHIYHHKHWYNNLLAIYQLMSLYPVLPHFQWVPSNVLEVMTLFTESKEDMTSILEGIIEWVQTNN